MLYKCECGNKADTFCYKGKCGEAICFDCKDQNKHKCSD